MRERNCADVLPRSTARRPDAPTIGTAYGLGLWAFMCYVFLPLNEGDGEDDLFTTDLVSPAWVWWVVYAALGMTAGLYFDVVRRIVRFEREQVQPPELRREPASTPATMAIAPSAPIQASESQDKKRACLAARPAAPAPITARS